MRLLLAIAVIALAAPAYGQESRTAEACVAALNHYLASEAGEIREIQDFPDLDPPRVRLIFGPEAVPIEARCEFASAESPVGLTDFCFIGRCFAPSGTSAGDPKRLEELHILLERDGF
jgi:hypothetical protein